MNESIYMSLSLYIEAHFKGDMIVANPNFKFLLADDILLGPVGIVFPEKKKD